MSPTPILVPRDTVNDDVVILVRWLVPQGAAVDPTVDVVEIETSKSLVRLAPESEGFLDRVAVEHGEVPVGGVLGYVTATPVERAVPAEPEAGTAAGGAKVSKKAQALMDAHGLDASAFPGLAVIREQDVQARIGGGSASATRAPIAERVPLSPSKRTEIRYLTAGNRDALLSAVTVLVPTAPLDAVLAGAGARRQSYLDHLVPAVAATLREHPRFNAVFDGQSVGLYADVNIGVAINVGTGLFVPVIRHADMRTPDEVASEIAQFAMSAMRGGFTEAQLSGGTFTITDLSGAGVHAVQPLINRDQVAILGMGLDTGLPRRLVLTLAFDHRVVDGMDAARWLEDLRVRLAPSAPARRPTSRLACGSCFITLDRLRQDGVAQYLVTVTRSDGTLDHVCPACLIGWTHD